MKHLFILISKPHHHAFAADFSHTNIKVLMRGFCIWQASVAAESIIGLLVLCA